MTALLDGNVLVALATANHIFHERAEEWIQHHEGKVATCPITQATLLRILMRDGYSAGQAQGALCALLNELPHEFWPNELDYADCPLLGTIGHRQVTDAYLAQQARQRGGRLVTFDEGLAQLHRDVAELA